MSFEPANNTCRSLAQGVKRMKGKPPQKKHYLYFFVFFKIFFYNHVPVKAVFLKKWTGSVDSDYL